MACRLPLDPMNSARALVIVADEPLRSATSRQTTWCPLEVDPPQLPCRLLQEKGPHSVRPSDVAFSSGPANPTVGRSSAMICTISRQVCGPARTVIALSYVPEVRTPATAISTSRDWPIGMPELSCVGLSLIGTSRPLLVTGSASRRGLCATPLAVRRTVPTKLSGSLAKPSTLRRSPGNTTIPPGWLVEQDPTTLADAGAGSKITAAAARAMIEAASSTARWANPESVCFWQSTGVREP